jgi:hypothetical protein
MNIFLNSSIWIQILNIVAAIIKVIVTINTIIEKNEADFIDHFSEYHLFKLITNKTIIKIVNGIENNSPIASKILPRIIRL